jgi:NAD(P)-dependent dehydrogenase (short-subunit alcohol dehydrogenase family)
MGQQLKGKVCVITGGAGSIGRATAKLLLDEGAKVMLMDLNETMLEKAAAEIQRNTAADCLAWAAADVTCSSEVRTCISQTVKLWGKIDVMFSNAGSFGTVAPVADYPEDIFDKVLAVNVKGAVLVAKHALPHMNAGGSVIITSSIVGVRGDPGVCAYVAAKHAQVGLMRVLAKEAAPRNIRVNTIHPGPVDNEFESNVEAKLTPVLGRHATEFFDDIIPLKRHARADEIAHSVLYLASDASSFTTGSTLMVDGGLSA